MSLLTRPADLPDHDRLLAMANRVARVGGWSIDLSDHTVRWTDEVAQIHEWPIDRPVCFDTVVAYYDHDSQARIREVLGATERDGTPFDVQLALQTPSGREVWVRAIGEAVRDAEDRIVRLQGALQDVTEQRRMELALQRASERLSSTLESISDAFFTLDDASRFTYVNSEAERLLQRPREQLLGRQIWAAFPAAVGTTFHTEYTRALRERVSSEFEAYYAPYDRWFVVKAYAVPDGLAVYFRDGTVARRANEQLRLLQSSVERLNDIVVITDAEPISEVGPRIVYVNQAFERLTGYSREEVIGQTPRILQGPRTDRRTLDKIRHALETWQPVRAEVQNYTKSGKELWLELDIVPLADEHGWFTHWVAVERDVTERRRLEQQILRAQRMESIGTLAGGIAHDLNNVLSPILMSVELLRPQLTDADGARRLDVIAQAASRGASMIRQVLGFARGIEGERRTLPLLPVIDETLRIVGETFPRNITVTADVPGDAWRVDGDPTQLQQVLLNLCVNARDAMPAGGTLTVAASNVQLDADAAARVLEARPGPYVRLTVGDTGVGIPPDQVEKIFDPFFTTKPPGQGTGLGLSTTLAIVRGHGGFVRVQSEPGVGTVVDVYLPRGMEDAGEHTVEPDGPLPRGDGETVLVVDDEAAIRATTREVLEAHGYQVLEAADGAEAIAVYAAHASVVRLVVTDLMMPVMDGPAMLQVLNRLAPDVRVIAASGLATSRDVQHAGAQGA
ncbi:MAG TPA: PAS domain S-box protein, partial [Gemmatimonadaceae bacterium]|nr:PAS domain S-box protein [Gemmatimonadaceae bacterium]